MRTDSVPKSLEQIFSIYGVPLKPVPLVRKERVVAEAGISCAGCRTDIGDRAGMIPKEMWYYRILRRISLVLCAIDFFRASPEKVGEQGRLTSLTGLQHSNM